MSTYKVLLGITGSIAAYKSAYLISKLVQNGFDVKIIATDYALKFIGKATLEGLSGNQVYTDSFEDGKMMSHINLVKWADITVICPATANTINKFAAGISDNLLTSLFLVSDFSKPILIAPAMNTNMYEHPATQEALSKIEKWGVEILPTSEGNLACGDFGKGKMIEPDEIFNRILSALLNKQKIITPLKILITAGGTRENIDGVRFLSNLSTGKTAASLADYFVRRKHSVTYLHSKDAALPANKTKNVLFTDYESLNKSISKIISDDYFDVIIHNAAVSDYSINSILSGEGRKQIDINKKIDSLNDEIILNLKRNDKIINRLKSLSKNKNVFVVGFKFTNTDKMYEREESVKKLFQQSNCDMVVLNDKMDRTDNGEQTNFIIFQNDFKHEKLPRVLDLAIKLEECFENKRSSK